MHNPIFEGILKSLYLSLLLSFAAPIAASELSPAKQQVISDPQNEREEVQKIIDAHYQAWNKHDAKELAALYAEDGDLRTPWNEIGKSRSEVEKIFANLFATREINAKIDTSIKSIRIIKPGIAFVDVESTITGMKTDNNSKYPPLHDHAVFLFVKINGNWQILIARPY